MGQPELDAVDRLPRTYKRGVETRRQLPHTAGVTYDLAVWEGSQPADDAAGGELFQQLYRKYLGEGSVDAAPTPAVRAYVEALLD